MAKPVREKLALVVFTACLAVIAVGVAAYMVAGHGWNYAATTIDDAAGEMEGYRVVLFEGTAVPARSRVDARGLLDSHPVSIAAARKGYRDKGAAVFELDACNPTRYDEPTVLEREGYRVGVVHLPSGIHRLDAQVKADYLVDHGCRAVVALADDPEAAARVRGVDVVVALQFPGVLPGGEQDGAYCVRTPAVGRLGAIVISPAEVVSSRTLQSS